MANLFVLHQNILVESEFSLVFLNVLLGRTNQLDDMYNFDEQVISHSITHLSFGSHKVLTSCHITAMSLFSS